MRFPFVLSLLLLPAAAPALADPMDLFTAENAVDSSRLEDARGGFLVADGLLVTLGSDNTATGNLYLDDGESLQPNATRLVQVSLSFLPRL